MIDTLWHIALSNTALAAALAALAWSAQLVGCRPRIVHLLWLLVLAKLIVPPLVSLPVPDLPGPLADTAAIERAMPAPEASEGDALVIVPDGRSPAPRPTDPMAAFKLYAVAAWGLGSAALLAWMLLQGRRFNRLLRLSGTVAPSAVRRRLAVLARALGLSEAPPIHVTAARVSPMVWYRGGRAGVILPAGLMDAMSPAELDAVIAHELAHIARRDHLVRWIEALACLLFWWNPIAWWARRNLRANEEKCCDAAALKALGGSGAATRYANALLSTAEFLAVPAARPPAAASPIDGGGSLERRLEMILSQTHDISLPRWTRPLLLGLALVLPVGATLAQGGDTAAAPESAALSAPRAGAWIASSDTAVRTTGDILLSKAGLTFENGRQIALTPAYSGSKHVFRVEPALQPSVAKGSGLCRAPITYVTLLAYNGFAMALHMYDDPTPPAEPTAATVTDLARMERCASQYYRAPQ